MTTFEMTTADLTAVDLAAGDVTNVTNGRPQPPPSVAPSWAR